MADDKTGEDTAGKGQGTEPPAKSGAGYGDHAGDKQKGDTEGTGDAKE